MKSKQKSIEEWFLHLPPGYNRLALLRRQEVPMKSTVYTYSLDEALFLGFVWRKTKEHYNWWQKLREAVMEGKDVSEYPPLPDYIDSI